MTTISGVWECPKFAPPDAIGTNKEWFNTETLVSGVVNYVIPSEFRVIIRDTIEASLEVVELPKDQGLRMQHLYLIRFSDHIPHRSQEVPDTYYLAWTEIQMDSWPICTHVTPKVHTINLWMRRTIQGGITRWENGHRGGCQYTKPYHGRGDGGGG